MTPDESSHLRLLLVEDETFIRHTIRQLLRSLGISDIREAADGAEALEALHVSWQPDLIVCDVQMAPMDGVTFLKAVRNEANSTLAATPVIVLTVSADAAVVREFRHLGISSYLLKPVSRKQLDEHITAAIRRSGVAAKRQGDDARMQTR
jgi:two-component system chemotaxis response regulator CheY